MQRKRIPPRERVYIFEQEDGICHLCHMKIHAGQEWDVSHEIPLEMGGEDGGKNLRVAHRKCHRIHTAKVDAPQIAKTKRMYASHIGARTSKRPLPGGRNTPFKRKMNGTVERRK